MNSTETKTETDDWNRPEKIDAEIKRLDEIWNRPARPVIEHDGAPTEYEHVCGSHGDHIKMLELIEGKWLTFDTWRKLAKEKLGFDEAKFEEYRGDFERTDCLAASETGDDLFIVQGVPLTENEAEQPTTLPKDWKGVVTATNQQIPVPPEKARRLEESVA